MAAVKTKKSPFLRFAAVDPSLLIKFASDVCELSTCTSEIKSDDTDNSPPDTDRYDDDPAAIEEIKESPDTSCLRTRSLLLLGAVSDCTCPLKTYVGE